MRRGYGKVLYSLARPAGGNQPFEPELQLESDLERFDWGDKRLSRPS